MNISKLTHPPLPKKAGDHQHWGSLYGCGSALAISLAYKKKPQPMLIITADSQQSKSLARELRLFMDTETEARVIHFPDWGILPYDKFAPHSDVVSQRLQALYQLPSLSQGILIISLPTLSHHFPPRSFLESQVFMVSCGNTIDLPSWRNRLNTSGYLRVEQVSSPGELRIQGSLIDIFPMGSPTPYRIDFFDNTVESIRTFDPETQRSLNKVSKIKLLPAHEFPLDAAGIAQFQENWSTYFPDIDGAHCPLYQAILNGNSPPGIECYLPLFFKKTTHLFEYLPANTLVYLSEGLSASAQSFWNQAQRRYEQYRYDRTRPLLKPSQIFYTFPHIMQAVKKFSSVYLHKEAIKEKAGKHNFNTQAIPSLALSPTANNRATALTHYLKHLSPGPVIFCTDSPGRQIILTRLLSNRGIVTQNLTHWGALHLDSTPKTQTYYLWVAAINEGIQSLDPFFTLITEAQLLRQDDVAIFPPPSKSEPDGNTFIRYLAELTPGDIVVHHKHGIGRYKGLETIETDNQNAEYVVLEYAKNDILYLPVTSLNLISRYATHYPEKIALHVLGSKKWQETRCKAEARIRDTAAEILEKHAQRATQKGYAFQPYPTEMQSFSDAFPFETTPDQQAAIDIVLQEMQAPRIMNRLICGDVGFGKTEIAMRAAFLATLNHRQVMVLAPTTLLAQQHFETFSDRFVDWPLQIGLLSRFQSPKEQKASLNALKTGQLDIIIGTHRLLQKDVEFRQLGLLIVDEEHRFGVNQKEKIHEYAGHQANSADLISLTATPIPRTLNMCLSSLYDISLITTPPQERLPIKTFVYPYEESIIKEAIHREMLRGGQIYFLHNAIKSIQHMADNLARLVPEAKIAVAHGQMTETALENIMSRFYHHQFDILVCTTIIESGIDIPNANTIIINRADQLGLAQLHQIRGRVGRSHHQAYAYLLAPPKKQRKHEANQRLEAITRLENLGTGFMLAQHDLEIRGAGDILGAEQSGHIEAIGFSLYMELLQKTITALQHGHSSTTDINRPEIEIHLPVASIIPDSYIPDVSTRLIFYKRIAQAHNEAALEVLQVEMIDRFGLLPTPVESLLLSAHLKQKAEKIGITGIYAQKEPWRIVFSESNNIDTTKILSLIQNSPQQFQLKKANTLAFTPKQPTKKDACLYDQLQPLDTLLNTLLSSNGIAQNA